MNPFSTHLPLLEKSIAFERPCLCVELGPGEFSTPVLRAGSDRLVSLEMNDRAWAESTGAVFDDRPLAWMRFVAMHPDLLFVDQGICHVNMAHRGLAVQMALDLGVRQVVAHDTEEQRPEFYGYCNIVVPPGYLTETDTSHIPHTTRWWHP